EARPPPRRSSRSTGRPSGARRKDTRRTEGPTSEPMSAPSAFHAGAAPRVALFATCLADRFFADACADAVRVLRHLGVEVEVPVGQTCCGQPAHSTGNREEAVRMARHTLATFADADHVVLPSGSCAGMLRRFYGELLGTPAAAALGARTWELAQFLVHILGAAAGPLGTGLAGRRVAYPHGCHALRELGVHDEPLALLRVCGTRVAEVSVGMADGKLVVRPDVDAVTSPEGGCPLPLAGRALRRGRERRTGGARGAPRPGPPSVHLATLLREGLEGAGGPRP